MQFSTVLKIMHVFLLNASLFYMIFSVYVGGSVFFPLPDFPSTHCLTKEAELLKC